jgi:hypothetical protein
LLFNKGELISPEIITFDKNGERSESIFTIEARIWEITKCKGCEKINLNVYKRVDPKENDILIHRFPLKIERVIPEWVPYLQIGYVELFIEIYDSINNGRVRLAMMGVRTLLDMFIVEKIGDAGTFNSKLDKLVSEKYISNDDKKLLSVALEFGNATIHRGFKPDKEEFNTVFDIIENLVYKKVLTKKSQIIESRIPKRK